jgi:hypothetical protein
MSTCATICPKPVEKGSRICSLVHVALEAKEHRWAEPPMRLCGSLLAWDGYTPLHASHHKWLATVDDECILFLLWRFP